MVMLLLLALLELAVAGSGTAGSAGIYVSPAGSDANDGSEARPFLTLRRAQQAARTSAPRLPVVLQRGTHRLALQPALSFTAEDGGTPHNEAVWRAELPGPNSGDSSASTRLSGGLRQSSWEPAPVPFGAGNRDDGVWRANVSTLVASANWPFRTLRVGDSLWPSARWPLLNASNSPEDDWLFLANWSCDKEFHPCPGRQLGARVGTGRLESTIPAMLGIIPGDLPLPVDPAADFASADLNLFGTFERDVLSQVLPLPIRGSESTSAWNLSDPSKPTLAMQCYGYQANQRYFFSNVKAGLARKRTWWLDREQHWLYLRLGQHRGADAAEWLRSTTTDISAPSLTSLVTIRGTQWLHLSRLAFVDAGTQWQGYQGTEQARLSESAREGSADANATSSNGGGVRNVNGGSPGATGSSSDRTGAGWPDCAVRVLDGSSEITLSNSSFRQLGGCGIEVTGAVQGVNVLSCLFSSIAAHGIRVNGFEQPAPGHTPHQLIFRGNVYQEVGQLFAGASGVDINGAAFGEISRSRFEAMPRNAIGLGSSFREPMVMTTNIVIR
jgi:hypothetical protein